MAKNTGNQTDRGGAQRGVAALQKSDMMAHLLRSLDEGKDIGHYGRLVFAMVARFFLDEEQLVGYLVKDPDLDEEQARALYLQVQGRDYNPPKRDRILSWQANQDFPICPNPQDLNACDVYSDLQFPDHVYDNIQEFYEEQAERQEQQGKDTAA